MSDERVNRLIRETVARHATRREVLRRAALLGVSASAVGATVARRPIRALAAQDSNPLGVDPAAALDVVIFKGGYGDNYALNVNTIYNTLYPDAQITYAGIQRLGEQLQPRFVDGSPPDIIDNSGAGNLDTVALVNEGQLADLADLMAAPAYGQEGVTFADSLIPGSQQDGLFNGKQHVLKYAYSAYGFWYSQKFMDANGYTYPTTWDEFLTLCADIKAGGVAPFTYQGQYPYYIRAVFDQLVFKSGGIEAIAALDNLEDGAWQSEVVGNALNALAQLHEQEFILEGTEGLSHTDSQAQWLQGRAAFIPCGSWLENEMGDLIPPDFGMTERATPSLTAEDRLPQTAIQASAGEDFIVPAQGKNVQGGKEYLRLLFSTEGARFFTQDAKSLTAVVGAAEGLELSSALASVNQAVIDAGANTFVAQYGSWYTDLSEEFDVLIGDLMFGRASVEDVQNGAQEAADAVKEDESIPKYRREVSATPAA